MDLSPGTLILPCKDSPEVGGLMMRCCCCSTELTVMMGLDMGVAYFNLARINLIKLLAVAELI